MANLKEKLFDLWWMLNTEVVGYSDGQEISGFLELEGSLPCMGACHSLSGKTGRVLARFVSDEVLILDPHCRCPTRLLVVSSK